MRLATVSVLLALAVAPLALGQDEPKEDKVESSKLDHNPFANATAGDWNAVSIAMTRGKRKMDVVLSWKVTKVEGDDVTVEFAANGHPKTRTFSKKESPTLEAVIDVGEGWKAGESTQEKKTVGGHEFACTKVSFKSRREECTIWFSKDVKGSGIVAITLTSGPDRNASGEIAGFGNGDKAEWGKMPEAPKSEPGKSEPGKPAEPKPAEPPK